MPTGKLLGSLPLVSIFLFVYSTIFLASGERFVARYPFSVTSVTASIPSVIWNIPSEPGADPRLHVGIFGELVLGVSLHVILIQIDAGDSIKADDRRDAVFFKGIGHRL